MRHLDGLAAIAGDYRGFVVDLWGVVHDGVRPYPGAVHCLQQLRRTGAHVTLLSNAPRRAHAAAAGLAAMGINPELYDLLMTSGEATWERLGEARGLRIYHLGPERDRSILEQRDVRLVDALEAAELLLNTGPDDLRDPTSLDPFLPELEAGLRAGVPMLCANPDLEVLRGAQLVLCAGALAAWYETRGGAVTWIGKPYPEIYRNLVERTALDPATVLAIGDSLRTDIAGAEAAGFSSCWVLGGIHGHTSGAAAEVEALAMGRAPTATIPALRW
jgi:HAD superfamily hydrolase (TIGR01459 family)